MENRRNICRRCGLQLSAPVGAKAVYCPRCQNFTPVLQQPRNNMYSGAPIANNPNGAYNSNNSSPMNTRFSGNFQDNTGRNNDGFGYANNNNYRPQKPSFQMPPQVMPSPPPTPPVNNNNYRPQQPPFQMPPQVMQSPPTSTVNNNNYRPQQPPFQMPPQVMQSPPTSPMSNNNYRPQQPPFQMPPQVMQSPPTSPMNNNNYMPPQQSFQMPPRGMPSPPNSQMNNNNFRPPQQSPFQMPPQVMPSPPTSPVNNNNYWPPQKPSFQMPPQVMRSPPSSPVNNNNYRPPQQMPPQVMRSPPPVNIGRKRAVLCGVNYLGHNKSLKGSINDVLAMKYLLVDKLGFPNASIMVLTEDQKDPFRIPTKANIRTALRWLVHGCQPGDSLVFHYSGHGSRVRDLDGDEVDGYDESLCPTDYETEGRILDDEVNETIVRPLTRGVTLHAIIDTCHSGTLLDLQFMCGINNRGASYMWEDHRTPYSTYKGTRGGIAISISACADHQSSGEAIAFTGYPSGALTYSFVKTLEQEPKLSYGRLLLSMHNKIHETQKGMGLNGKNVQEPQLSSSERFDVHSNLVAL